jgi:hypothetical protein
MMIETQKYERNPFPVQAVQVDEHNVQDVADWCAGSVNGPKGAQYVKVNVFKPMNDRQTQAFVGDWVLYAESGGFKVYPDKAFKKNFTLSDETVHIQETPEKFEPEDAVNPTFTHGDKRVEAEKNINRVTEAHDEKVARDARTGEFVTEDYARAHPTTTVTETTHRHDAHLG